MNMADRVHAAARRPGRPLIVKSPVTHLWGCYGQQVYVFRKRSPREAFFEWHGKVCDRKNAAAAIEHFLNQEPHTVKRTKNSPGVEIVSSRSLRIGLALLIAGWIVAGVSALFIVLPPTY